jgi:hypothetical protein
MSDIQIVCTELQFEFKLEDMFQTPVRSKNPSDKIPFLKAHPDRLKDLSQLVDYATAMFIPCHRTHTFMVFIASKAVFCIETGSIVDVGF